MTDALQERDAQMAAAYISGATLEEVSARFGCTRENVRLRLNLLGVAARHRGVSIDPLLVIAIVRRTETHSFADVSRAMGEPRELVRRVVVALGLGTATQRLFKWRRDRVEVARYQRLAAEIGRTPAVSDLGRAGMQQSSVQQRFGGMRRLARRAGLEPNSEGNYAGRPRRVPA